MVGSPVAVKELQIANRGCHYRHHYHLALSVPARYAPLFFG